MSSHELIDMSAVPVPDVIQGPDFEQRLSELKAQLLQLAPELEEALSLESEPVAKLLELASYREMLLVQKINDATRANMLASARGNDLEALASNYNIARLVIDDGDPSAQPPVPRTLESDDALRRRTQMAFDGLNTAGSIDSYIYHALSADGRVLDANAVSPLPTEITLTILSHEGDGSASPELLKAVRVAFGLTPDGTRQRGASKIRPQGDRLTVSGAGIINYKIDAEVVLHPGPAHNAVLETAQHAIRTYVDRQHRLGATVTLSGIHRALHQPGAQNVLITSPASDIEPDMQQAAFCTEIALTYSLAGGDDD